MLENQILFVVLRVVVSKLIIRPIYNALIRPELEYSYVPANNVTFTCSDRLENTQSVGVMALRVFSSI